MYPAQTWRPGSPKISSMPGASANSRSRSRFRTLQKRLNLKKKVTHASSDKMSQTSGLRPRAATNARFTAAS